MDNTYSTWTKSENFNRQNQFVKGRGSLWEFTNSLDSLLESRDRMDFDEIVGEGKDGFAVLWRIELAVWWMDYYSALPCPVPLAEPVALVVVAPPFARITRCTDAGIIVGRFPAAAADWKMELVWISISLELLYQVISENGVIEYRTTNSIHVILWKEKWKVKNLVKVREK